MRTLWLLLAAMALAPTRAVAEEPTGFDRFAFGTMRDALVVDPLFLARCRPAPEIVRTDTMRIGLGAQGARITCPTYTLNDLGGMRAALLFSAEDRLVGYVLFVARARVADVHDKIETLYGPATSQVEQGRTLAWRWPSGTEASLTTLCRGTDGCVTVKAKRSRETGAPVRSQSSN